MHRDNKFENGIILGALIGGVAALLFSPRSGEKNRALLTSKLDRAKNIWHSSEGDVAATLTSLFGDVTKNVDIAGEKARAYFDKALAETKLSLAELKEKDLDDVVAQVRSRFEEKEDIAYNDSWLENLKRDWQTATKANRTNRNRKA